MGVNSTQRMLGICLHELCSESWPGHWRGRAEEEELVEDLEIRERKGSRRRSRNTCLSGGENGSLLADCGLSKQFLQHPVSLN
jgi:hypothetical protein